MSFWCGIFFKERRYVDAAVSSCRHGWKRCFDVLGSPVWMASVFP